MKIAIVGCGALGSYYGARLCRVGHEVHFLLRSDFEVVRHKGVRVLSTEGDFHVSPRCAQNPHDIGFVDLVLVALKTTANAAFESLIRPLVGERTAILTLQNGLGNEEKLGELFRVEKILGGLCFVCLNRIEPGVIQHVAHGRIIMGEFNRHPESRTHVIASAIRHSGVPCDVTENLARAHWEKLVWNVPFNGLGVASTAGFEAVTSGCVNPKANLLPPLTTDLLLADPEWEHLVRELMREVIGAANALKLNIPADAEEVQIARTLQMGAYRASTLVDFEKGLPLEIKSIFLEPLRQAQRAGVDAPRLEKLCSVLTALNER